MTQYKEVGDDELMSLYGGQPRPAQPNAQIAATQLAPMEQPKKAKEFRPEPPPAIRPGAPAPDMAAMLQFMQQNLGGGL